MKIPNLCSECIEQYSNEPFQFEFNPITDDGVQYFECKNGHRYVATIQAEKFELLVESGLYAIIDEYYREAIASIAAGLERLYEYFIRVVSKKNNIDNEIYSKTWKQFSSSSERQFGAFTFLYLTAFNEEPPIIHKNQVEFRNAVIHKGYFPTREENIKYVDEVIKVMSKIIAKIKIDFNDTNEAISWGNLKEKHKIALRKGDKVHNTNVPTILNFTYKDYVIPELEDYLHQLGKRKTKLENPILLNITKK